MVTKSSTVNEPVEIIKDKLYWISDRSPPKNQSNAYFFCIDSDLEYQPFFADFGPLDLGKTYRFVTELEKLLQDPNFLKCKIYHYTSLDNAKRANAATLMGAFQVLILKRSADEAWLPFKNVKPAFVDYRDASYGSCTYKLSILDCLRGLEYAVRLKWFDLKTFNLRDYEFFEKVENGDMNWIIPGKFLAFSGPSSNPRDPEGWRTFTPEDYVPIFKKIGVTHVVRLNKKQYPKESFTKNGIKHTDLYFLDGSTPSDEIIDEFLKLAENEKGAIAVHCKAGLGRTGTLICCYAMKHYKFPAADFIGWIRLARPGSILGPQQQFVNDKEAKFHKMSDSSPVYQGVLPLLGEKAPRLSLGSKEPLVPARKSAGAKVVDMSPEDKAKAVYGDFNQAERLLEAKRGHRKSPSIGGSPSTKIDRSPSSKMEESPSSQGTQGRVSPLRDRNSPMVVERSNTSVMDRHSPLKTQITPLRSSGHKRTASSNLSSGSYKNSPIKPVDRFYYNPIASPLKNGTKVWNARK